MIFVLYMTLYCGCHTVKIICPDKKNECPSLSVVKDMVKVLTLGIIILYSGYLIPRFFYQGSNGSVLYTGDFRLTLEETKRLRSLHCGGR